MTVFNLNCIQTETFRVNMKTKITNYYRYISSVQVKSKDACQCKKNYNNLCLIDYIWMMLVNS